MPARVNVWLRAASQRAIGQSSTRRVTLFAAAGLTGLASCTTAALSMRHAAPSLSSQAADASQASQTTISLNHLSDSSAAVPPSQVSAPAAMPAAKESSQPATSATPTDSSVTVTVNGDSISVPKNGTLNRTVVQSDGTTTLTISSQSTDSDSSFKIHLDTTSDTSASEAP